MITYTASDGLEIPAVLTTPPGGEGPYPLVVLPHGGPQVRDDLRFDWWAQAYAQMGYMVLQPNYRGSAGYGLEFIEAGYDEFGGRMVEDMLDGARHLQSEGLAHAGGFCMAGASYGGYAALMGAILAPEEVACVVAVNPVTEPVSLIGEGLAVDAESLVTFWERYVGDRYMSGEAASEISVVSRAGELAASILVFHGEEDNVVSIDQSQALARSLRGSDQFTFVPLEGDDHYMSRAGSRREVLERSLALFDETIGD